MKKRMLSMVLTTALLLCGLAGCTTEKAGGASGDKKDEGKSQEKVTIGMCPKFTSDPYMVAAGEGAQEACDELGYTLDFNGPVNADIAAQSDIIDQWTQKKYTAITISANDADALSPAMKAAQDAGIYTSAWDADVNADSRELFLNQVTFEGMGKTMVDMMVEEAGSSGDFLVVTAVLTAPNQNAWIEEMKKYMEANYPDMKIVDILAGDEDLAKSRDVTLNYLRSHPETKGVFAVTGMASPGVCEAIEQLDLVGKVAVTGLGVPSLIKDYLKKGTINQCCLWSPYDIGYGAMYLAKTQIDGKLDEAKEQGYIEAGRLGKLEFIDKDKGIVLLGDPLIFTKDNVDDYDF